MATDIVIDPVTRDFVETDDGEWEESDDARTAVFCQLDSREGRWWGDPFAGSRNAEILESDLPTPESLRDSSRRAMLALAGGGLVSDVHITITTHDKGRGFAGLLFQWRDRSSNRPADLAYSPLGGAPPP